MFWRKSKKERQAEHDANSQILASQFERLRELAANTIVSAETTRRAAQQLAVTCAAQNDQLSEDLPQNVIHLNPEDRRVEIDLRGDKLAAKS